MQSKFKAAPGWNPLFYNENVQICLVKFSGNQRWILTDIKILVNSKFPVVIFW